MVNSVTTMAKNRKQDQVKLPIDDDDALSRSLDAALDSDETGLSELVDKAPKTDSEQKPALLIPKDDEDELEDKLQYDRIMGKLGFQKYKGLGGKTENLYLNNKGLAILLTLYGKIVVRLGYSLNSLQEFRNEEIGKAQLRNMVKQIILQYINRECRKTTSYTFNPKKSIMSFEYSVRCKRAPNEQTIEEVRDRADKLKIEINKYVRHHLDIRIGERDVKLIPAKVASNLLERRELDNLKSYLKTL